MFRVVNPKFAMVAVPGQDRLLDESPGAQKLFSYEFSRVDESEGMLTAVEMQSTRAN